MHNIVRLLVLSVAVFSTAVFAESGKVAVVDLSRAIFATDVAKARVQQLSSGSEYAALQAKFDSINADIKTMQKDAETKGATWSQQQAADYQKKVEYLLADRELAARKLQAERQALQNDIVTELRPKAVDALSELLEAEGIELLLNAQAVIRAKPEMDITAKLTDRLNKKTQ